MALMKLGIKILVRKYIEIWNNIYSENTNGNFISL